MSREPTDHADAANCYEERITLWHAATAAEAIVKAEAEAETYAAQIEDAPDEYLGFAQSYALEEHPGSDGVEVFSLIRDSDLDAESYLSSFLDTGRDTSNPLRTPAQDPFDTSKPATFAVGRSRASPA